MMKRLLWMVFALCVFLQAEEIIDISVKGISDGQRDDPQKDRMEAIMDAKRQACEKAGIKIKSASRVENFKLAYDMVESKAEAVLLPGFQVMDVGYVEDGTYNVVLIGKLRLSPQNLNEFCHFTLIMNFSENNPITKPHHVFDRLYKWLSLAHGEILINGVPLEDLEENIVKVTKGDTLFYNNTRIYALTYRLPTGRFTYTQRTPNRDGSTSNDDFKLKLRPNLKYVMEVGRPNALYFRRPREFDGTITESQNFKKYPDDFKVIFTP